MADEKEVKEHEPRWDVIEKLHDKIDNEIDEAFRVNRLSFIEVDIALLMIHEKLQQQKMELYNIYRKQRETEGKVESEPDKKDAPDNVYG
tara:strand:- start:1089 stop:1358 length:270 start_codon:yes stop_codon:yes gene_type:complete